MVDDPEEGICMMIRHWPVMTLKAIEVWIIFIFLVRPLESDKKNDTTV